MFAKDEILVYDSVLSSAVEKPFGPDKLQYSGSKTNIADSQFEPVDNLTSLLSQTPLNPESSTTTCSRSTNSQRLNIHYEDGIDQVIRNVLTPDLKVASGDEMLRPDHPCFELAREYTQSWRISDQAVDNLIHLACEYLEFLIMMLLNPSPNHELLSLYEMIEE
jgi:hypothetical protein